MRHDEAPFIHDKSKNNQPREVGREEERAASRESTNWSTLEQKGENTPRALGVDKVREKGGGEREKQRQ